MFNGEELYRQLDGDYGMMLRRLKKDSTIQLFLQEFVQEDTFCKLELAMQNGDDQAAFEHAHALKGVVLNMELGFLAKSVSKLTEALRGGKKPNADALFEQAKKDYARTVELIQQSCDNG